ncbi:MAG: hypothetical protein ACREK3_04670 [Gemmatimonadota bacterium]
MREGYFFFLFLEAFFLFFEAFFLEAFFFEAFFFEAFLRAFFFEAFFLVDFLAIAAIPFPPGLSVTTFGPLDEKKSITTMRTCAIV